MRSTSMTGPDDDHPPPDDLEHWHRTRTEPGNEVAVTVPLTAVLGRTAALAVVLTSVQACSTGFGFQVSVRLRQSPVRGDDLFGQLMGNPATGGRFLLGVEFADGRRGSTLVEDAGWPLRPGLRGGGRGVSVTGVGGGGGGRRLDQDWWVAPLPPDGPLRIVTRWDAQGLDETVTELDGGVVAGAGRRAEVLWPWEPEREDGPEHEGPPRPASGWFAQP